MNTKSLLLLTPLVGICFFFLFQCGSDTLQQHIETLYRDEQFDCADLEQVMQYLGTQQSTRESSRFITADQLDKQKLIQFIERTLGTTLPALENCDSGHQDNAVSIDKINMFIENSGSMDGYVAGITDYESVLSDIIVESNHFYGKEKVAVNFITDKLYPAKVKNISSFFKSLTPGKAPFAVGDKSVSELNELFKLVLDSTAEKDISIFVSDCIYSLDKSSSTVNGLIFQQNLTKAVFLDKSKEFPLSAYLLQLHSSFNGNYYDHRNGKTKLQEVDRPYYIWILGKDPLLKQFLSTINPAQYKGFANSYFMGVNAADAVPFEVLASTNKVGKSRFNKRDKTILEQVELVKNVFQFSIAADLSDYPDKNNLLNTHSYKITPGFELLSVELIPENNQPELIKSNEWVKIAKKGYSHLFTIKTESSNFLEDFKLAYVNNIPGWVTRSHTDDDTDMSKNIDKTFGLQYLVTGVQSAYETLNQTAENTLSINLKLTR